MKRFIFISQACRYIALGYFILTKKDIRETVIKHLNFK